MTDIPARLALRKWHIIKTLGDHDPNGKGILVPRLSTLVPPEHREMVGKEVDNVWRQTELLDRIKQKVPGNKGKFAYFLTDFGKRVYKALDTIEIKPTAVYSKKTKSPTAVKSVSTQTPLPLEPVYTSSVGANKVSEAVDELIKENVSLRKAMMITMKQQLIELNRLRVLLGYEEITNNDLPENRGDSNE